MWDPIERAFALVAGLVCLGIGLFIGVAGVSLGLYAAVEAGDGEGVLVGLLIGGTVLLVAAAVLAVGGVLVAGSAVGRFPGWRRGGR